MASYKRRSRHQRPASVCAVPAAASVVGFSLLIAGGPAFGLAQSGGGIPPPPSFVWFD